MFTYKLTYMHQKKTAAVLLWSSTDSGDLDQSEPVKGLGEGGGGAGENIGGITE